MIFSIITIVIIIQFFNNLIFFGYNYSMIAFHFRFLTFLSFIAIGFQFHQKKANQAILCVWIDFWFMMKFVQWLLLE